MGENEGMNLSIHCLMPVTTTREQSKISSCVAFERTWFVGRKIEELNRMVMSSCEAHKICRRLITC